MKNKLKKHGLVFLVLALLLFDIFLIQLDLRDAHRKLTFAMLDVGQGDALFIESPSGTQVLLDAGPSKNVLKELGKVIPFYDKTIDAIIISHPDQDHIGGFSEILKNYKVGKVFEGGTKSDSKTYENLEEEIKNQNIPNILAQRGMRLNLGGGAVIDILFPDRDVSSWDTNEGSIVARLSYGNNKIMLTGDATKKTEDIILSENKKEDLESDILKVSHHGSHTATSDRFIRAVSPENALISVGKDNKYGHPSQETLDVLSAFKIKVFRTDQTGTVIIKSNGQEENISFLE